MGYLMEQMTEEMAQRKLVMIDPFLTTAAAVRASERFAAVRTDIRLGR
jgi:hypothetical protein